MAELEALAAEARQARKEKRDAVASLMAKEAKLAPREGGRPAPKPEPAPKPAQKPPVLDSDGTVHCTLTKEQFGPGPSEETLRRGRAMRDKFEAEAKKLAEKERLRKLRGFNIP
jgi:hypothetical protein